MTQQPTPPPPTTARNKPRRRALKITLGVFALLAIAVAVIYVDSPLAMRLTEIHRDHPEAYTPTARRLMDKDPMYFGSKYVEFCATWDDSRRLNYLPGPMVIIASSGMCEAGRIRHHLRHVVDDPDNAIVIVSYQAEGTLGRQIAEGVERVQILDQWHDLNAAVYVLDGFSGHADRNDLAWWFEQTGGEIEHGFLVHGEPESLEALAPVLQPHVLNPVGSPSGTRPTRSEPGPSRRRPDHGRGGPSTASRPAASSPTNRPISLDDLGAGQVLGLGQPPDQGAADDQAVGHRGELADVLGRADPEADADRQVGLGPEPGDVLGQLGGQRLPLAGDPGHRDVVDEPGRRAGDPHGAVARGRRRDELDQPQVERGRLPAERLRLLDRQVGDDQAVDPGGHRLAEVAVDAPGGG